MIKLNIDQSLFNPVYIQNENLFDYSHRWNFYKGSSGSGKSRYILQKLVIKALKFPNSRIMVCRRYGSTLLNSVMNETKKVLIQLGVMQYCNVSDYNRIYTLPNGSQIIFQGLDDETKLLSLSDIDTIFVEEVFEVPEETLTQLSLRMRGKAAPNMIMCAFNPISRASYLHRWLEEEPEKYFEDGELYYLTTTYKDNYFLPESYIRSLEKLRDSNYKKYVVYALGEWGANDDAKVYKNVTVHTFDVNKVLWLDKIQVRLGIDFGYVDPTAVSVAAFDIPRQRIFIIDEVYKRGLTLDQCYEQLVSKNIQNTRNKFYADSADQRAISFLRSKGVHLEPVKKTKIETGVSYLQNFKIYVLPTCTNFINEFNSYEYKQNKVTGLYHDDQFEGPDHLMDALRYSASDLYNGKTLKTDESLRYFRI